jgi:hypothetical protein
LPYKTYIAGQWFNATHLDRKLTFRRLLVQAHGKALTSKAFPLAHQGNTCPVGAEEVAFWGMENNALLWETFGIEEEGFGIEQADSSGCIRAAWQARERLPQTTGGTLMKELADYLGTGLIIMTTAIVTYLAIHYLITLNSQPQVKLGPFRKPLLEESGMKGQVIWERPQNNQLFRLSSGLLVFRTDVISDQSASATEGGPLCINHCKKFWTSPYHRSGRWCLRPPLA